MVYRIPLLFEPQPEGGYTVTCPLVPGLVTEGDTIEEGTENAKDAFLCLLEVYEDRGMPLPAGILVPTAGVKVLSDTLVFA